MKEIPLSQLLPIEKPKNYKLHIAKWNGEANPLDDFVKNFETWKWWNRWKPKANVFNRPYIFSLIDFYPEKNRWLFGGIWKVLERDLSVKRDFAYEIEIDQKTAPFIGRLVLKYRTTGRNVYRLFESEYEKITVSHLFKESYSGEAFCGYENINHNFSAIESIIKIQKQDWKGALANVKGVYLISDKSNGKKYIGSAYGEMGIWARWKCYVNTGHGWSDELTKVITKKGIEYARENFTISLLEYLPSKTEDRLVIARENFWKECLMTRGEFGYNKN